MHVGGRDALSDAGIEMLTPPAAWVKAGGGWGGVFECWEFCAWRGLGSIDHSGVRIRAEYARFDAEQKFTVPDLKIADPKSCQCGEVLKGVIKPRQCKIFGTACTPENPMGALMVSSEGACAADYSYGGIEMDDAGKPQRVSAP